MKGQQDHRSVFLICTSPEEHEPCQEIRQSYFSWTSVYEVAAAPLAYGVPPDLDLGQRLVLQPWATAIRLPGHDTTHNSIFRQTQQRGRPGIAAILSPYIAIVPVSSTQQQQQQQSC